MANGISPIGLANTGIPPQGGAPEAGALDFLQSTPLGMALMQGGLGMLSGQSGAQSFGQGFSLYQQLMSQQEGSAQKKADQALKERQVATAEGELKRKIDKDAIDAKHLKAQAAAAIKEAKAPKGVDEKIWKQALDTEKAAAPLDDMGMPAPIDRAKVYRRYNSMAGETGTKAYMPMGASESSALIKAANENPEFADLLFSEAGTLYGPKVSNVQKRWQALKEKGEKKDETPTGGSAKIMSEALSKTPSTLAKPTGLGVGAVPSPYTATPPTPSMGFQSGYSLLGL